MHNIHGYKIVTLVLFLIGSSFISSELMGQTLSKDNINFWEFRNKPFYFGLTLGAHTTGYITSKSSQFQRSDSISFIGTPSRSGLHVNIITNLKIGQYFDFRFIPGFGFSERRLVFNDLENILEGQRFSDVILESNFLEIPLLLRFKSAPYKDKRLFVVAGLKYSYDVSSTSSTREELRSSLLQIAPHDFQFEIGAGIQLFYPFFIFSPEIKFSRGLSNIHIFNGELEGSRIIDKILSRTFSISLHFEG